MSSIGDDAILDGPILHHAAPEFNENTFDISSLVGNHGLKQNDYLKKHILSSILLPSKSFKYPSDNSRNLKFHPHWQERYDWIAYSKKEDGIFCKLCVLFLVNDVSHTKRQVAMSFVTIAFSNWKKALGKFENHCTLQYHKNSAIMAANFKKILAKQVNDVATQNKAHNQAQIQKNRQFLRPIIETIIFCARHDLPLRGNFDSGPIALEKPRNKDGKFRALLRFRANSGDIILREHLTNCAKNAMYTSPSIQNEILTASASVIHKKLINKIQTAEIWTMLADGTNDNTATEQVSICARYLDLDEKNDFIIREDFLCFVPIYDQTAENLTTVILNAFTNLGLDLNNCIGQGYDGASTMSGHVTGVRTRVSSKYPLIKYVHCMSHRLNLAISNGITTVLLKNTLTNIEIITKYFRKSVRACKILRDSIELYAPT